MTSPAGGERDPDEEGDENDRDLFDAPDMTATPVGVIEGPDRSARHKRVTVEGISTGSPAEKSGPAKRGER